MGTESIDIAIQAIIKASKDGYEWRAIPNRTPYNGSYTHYFFNPKLNKYDNGLREKIANTSHMQKSEWLKYVITHPIMMLSFLSNAYRMRARVLAKEYQ